jgi:SNF2 family DNA or RNA helicase
MIRRLKKDVLKELPPKRRQMILLETDNSLDKSLAQEVKLYDDYIKERGGLTFDVPEFSELAKIRKQNAIAKIPFVIEYLEEVLNETGKIVVWAHHHEVVDALAAEFGDLAVKLDGRDNSNERRQLAVDAFQTDPKIKIFIGSIMAAGVGITLTAASVAVFAESSWSPKDTNQAEDRLHRKGQLNAVTIQHLVLKNSLDEREIQVMIGKQDVADRGLDSKGE